MKGYDSVDKRLVRTKIDLMYILEYYYEKRINSQIKKDLIYLGFPSLEAKDVEDWSKALSQVFAIEKNKFIYNNMHHKIYNAGFKLNSQHKILGDFTDIMQAASETFIAKRSYSEAEKVKISTHRNEITKLLDKLSKNDLNIINLDYTGMIVGDKTDHGLKNFFQFQKQNKSQDFLLLVTFYVTERSLDVQQEITDYINAFDKYLNDMLVNIESEDDLANIDEMETILNNLADYDQNNQSKIKEMVIQLKTQVERFHSGIRKLLKYAMNQSKKRSSYLRAAIVIPYLIAHFAGSVGYKSNCKQMLFYKGKSTASTMFHGIFRFTIQNRLIFHNYDFPLKDQSMTYIRDGKKAEYNWDREVKKNLEKFSPNRTNSNLDKEINPKICAAIIDILLSEQIVNIPQISDIRLLNTVKTNSKVYFCNVEMLNNSKTNLYIVYSLTQEDCKQIIKFNQEQTISIKSYILCTIIEEPLKDEDIDTTLAIKSIRGFFCKKCGSNLNECSYLNYSRYGIDGLYFCFDCFIDDIIHFLLRVELMRCKKRKKIDRVALEYKKISCSLRLKNTHAFEVQIKDVSNEKEKIIEMYIVYILDYLTKKKYLEIKNYNQTQDRLSTGYILCDKKENFLDNLSDKKGNLIIKSISR